MAVEIRALWPADEAGPEQDSGGPGREGHERQHRHHRLKRPALVHLALLFALLLGGCSGAQFVNALTPSSGYAVERDLPYGPGPRQRLDLYVPDDLRPGAPLVVFFYGGGWETGSKELYPFAAQAFTSRGYPVAVPDYRLYPEARWRDFLADGAAAAAEAARRFQGRPLVLAGHSAGAYTAAMLALDRTWLDRADVPRCRVAAGVGLAGPYDFLPLDTATLRGIFGPGPATPETQPITYADPSDPPLLLITGTADDTVRPGNTLRLAERLRQVGGEAETRLYEGMGHVRLVASLASALRWTAPTLDDVDRFIREAVREGEARCGEGVG